MGHACTPHELPPHEKDANEHPVVAVIAVIAIFVAMLLITWARVEVHGTADIEAALAEPPAQGDLPLAPAPDLRPDAERALDAAVTANRFATGLSP